MKRDYITPSKETWYVDRDGDFYLPKEIVKQVIDENNPNTFIPLLALGDYPYIKFCWNNLKQYHPNKNIFGRYLALMKLHHWKDYRFKDSIYNDTEVWHAQ